MEWLAIMFTILTVITCYIFFEAKIVWWETIIPIASVLLFILIFKVTAETIMTTDTEYWSGYVTSAEYFEPWDEEVSCSHPKYCSESYTDSDGKSQTREVQCGYQHLYDVDYHWEYWQKTDNNGITKTVNQSEFNRLVTVLGNKNFVDLGRDYHSRDGDKYMSKWIGSDESIDIMCHTHRYENRVQASNSVFSFQEVSEEDHKSNKLFEYPEVDRNFKQRHILGANNRYAEKQMEILNAKLGRKKQVKAFILVFNGKSKKSAELQEQYWKGGNKNEFIVCVGVDTYNNIKWSHMISWNKNKTLNIRLRNWIMEQKSLNLANLSKEMYVQIDEHFQRQEFADFSYIHIDLTIGQMIWLWILTILISVGSGFWMVMNNITEE